VVPNSGGALFPLLGLSTCEYIHPRFIKPPVTSIHNMDDDSLLRIFYLCRPHPFEEDEYGYTRWGDWLNERWWYKFVQVCRRWRYLILGSAFHLGLCLVCTHGTPVAGMLAHFPPFPLIIDHDYENHNLTTEDERGILLALQQPTACAAFALGFLFQVCRSSSQP